MKRVLTLALALIMVLCLFAGCEKGGKGGNKGFDGLAVGVGRVDITPDNPIGAHINGGGDPNRMAEGILDEMVVTCVAVTDEQNNTVLFYHQDLHNPIAEGYTNAARQAISSATGVPFENIYMAATHTHSTLIPTDSSTTQNTEWTEKYNAAIVEAAKVAMEDRAPATMQAGTMDAKAQNGGQQMAFVRHYLLSDGSVAGSNFGNYSNGQIVGFPYEADNEMQIIRFTREGKNDVMMLNWPAHSTFHGTTALRNISADYPYYLRTYIEQNTGATCAIFLSGAGDQAPNASLYPAANHGLECADYGAALGKLVVDFLGADGNMKEVDASGAIKQETVTVTVDTNKIPAELNELASKAEDVYQYFLDNGQAEGTAYAVSQGFQSCYEARSFVSRLGLPDKMDIEIYMMTLGNMSFAIAPYEMSSGSAIAIKEGIAASGAYDMAFILAYCQDNLGYIPAKSNFEYNNGRSSYEAYDCSYAKGTCELLADTYVSTLIDMKSK